LSFWFGIHFLTSSLRPFYHGLGRGTRPAHEGGIETGIKYSFPKIGELADLVVTNNRETAKSCIVRGYKLFTVPQMFGAEEGVITLVLEAQNQKANPMSVEDADRVLTDYETASREKCTF